MVALVVLGVGLVQLPLLMDMLTSAVATRHHAAASRAVARIVVAATLALFVGAIATFFAHHFPRLVDQDGWLPALGHTAALLYLWIAALVHYGHACLCRPTAAMLRHKTVPDFDHRCPFTMNLVWRDNTHSFYFFLTFVLVGISYACLLSAGEFWLVWIKPLFTGVRPRGSPPPASLVFLATAAIWQAVFALWSMHSYLLAVDLTTAEAFAALRSDGVLPLLTAPAQYRRGRPSSATRLQRLIQPALWHNALLPWQSLRQVVTLLWHPQPAGPD